MGSNESRLQKRRCDRVVGFIFAVIGAIIGFIIFAWIWDELDPVSVAIIRSNRPGAGSELAVDFFGKPGYTKTSPEPHGVELEADLLGQAVPLAFMLIGTCLVAYVGWRAGSRLGRKGALPTSNADAIADYDEAKLSKPPQPPT